MGVFQGLDALVDDLIEQFAFVVEQPLYAVVLGGNQTFRPIDINRLVCAAQNRLEVVAIDDALIAQTGVVQTVTVARFDLLIDRLQHPVASGVEQSDVVIIDIHNVCPICMPPLVLLV